LTLLLRRISGSDLLPILGRMRLGNRVHLRFSGFPDLCFFFFSSPSFSSRDFTAKMCATQRGGNSFSNQSRAGEGCGWARAALECSRGKKKRKGGKQKIKQNKEKK
jgi:hypothetical protein